MDITTAGGIAAGAALVALAILLGGAGFGPYLDIPSVLIVFGGTIAVISGQFESKDLARVGKALGVAFNKVPVEPTEELIEKITFYATEIKKHGVMHIEQKVLEEPNPFFKEAFQLLVDGTKAETLVPLLETKLEHIAKRHNTMISLFGSASSVAGSMGMIGTLVGLVAMLANLSDPSSVGPAMAVALITTLYGALIGTLFAGLIQNKLDQKNNVEMNACDIIILGTSMIAEEAAIGDIKMKLNAILAEAPE